MRKMISVMLLIVSLFSIHSVASNQQPVQEPEIVICEGAQLIPKSAIDAIKAENPNAGVITIYEYVGEKAIQTPPIAPFITTSYTNVKTTYSNVKTNTEIEDKQVFSVAKGETTVLKASLSASVKGSFSKLPFVMISGVDVTITGTYEQTLTYQGPPESSPYNSRVFRIKFYGETGNYVQTADKITVYTGSVITTEPVSTSGSYIKPTAYAKYSVDSYLVP